MMQHHGIGTQDRQTQVTRRSCALPKVGRSTLKTTCSYSRNDYGERPSRQYDRPNRSDNNDRPSRSYSNDRPTRSYDNDRPTRSYDNDRPTRSYDNDRPTRSYDNDRPQRSYDRSGSPGEGGQGQRRSRPPPRQNEMTRQINGEIQQATNFQQLYEILQSRQDSLDSFHIIAMLLKIGKGEVTGPQNDQERGSYEELIALLYGWMASQVASYNPNQLATALYGIGKLNYYNAEIVTALTDKSYLILAQLKPIELSNTLWAFARLGVSPGEPWLKQFEFRSKAKLSQFRGVELSNTIASMARLGYRPDDEWLAEFAASAAQQLRHARAQELTNILWGMASLGYHPGQEMLEELLSALQAQMSYAKVADLVKLMYAMTQYDSRPSPEFLTGYTASFTNQIRYVTGQDLASVLYSMAFLQVKPADDKLRFMVDNVLRKKDGMTADNLADVAVALATMQVRPMRNWCEDFEVVVGSRLQECSDDGLGKIVGALQVLTGTMRAQDIANEAQMLLQQRAAMAPAEEEATEAPAEAADVYAEPVAA